MHFVCSTSELNSALNVVSHALPSKSPNPILEGILVETDKDHILITATDKILCINTFIPAEIREEGKCVIPGKLLCDLVRKLPDEYCDIHVNNRQYLTIKSGQFVTTLAVMDTMEYPHMKTVTGDEVEVTQKDLKEMIAGTIFSVAVDTTRPILTGCLVEVSGDELNVVAIDGFRMGIKTKIIEQNSHTISSVVPGKVMGDIQKILNDSEEKVKLCIGKNLMSMDMDNVHLVSILLEGEFIRYRAICPTDWQTRVIVNRSKLNDAIDRAGLIARGDKSNQATFRIEDNVMTIYTRSENSNMEEKLDISQTGMDVNITFNVKYLNDIMKAISDEEIEMRFKSSVSPCVITPIDHVDYTYLLLPIRTFEG
jgi:DNA polymerase-3 subunit beta